MNNQWFYLRQWKQKAWERLLEHRTVRVSWDTDEEDQREILPQFVMIPEGIELTNDSISNYLSNTCLLYTSPSPRDRTRSRMPSSA